MTDLPPTPKIWPPDFDTYALSSFHGDEMLNILHVESENDHAPDSYRTFLKNVHNWLTDLKRNAMTEEIKARLEREKTCTAHLSRAVDNYDSLHELYLKEHKERVELEQKNITLREELVKLRETLEPTSTNSVAVSSESPEQLRKLLVDSSAALQLSESRRLIVEKTLNTALEEKSEYEKRLMLLARRRHTHEQVMVQQLRNLELLRSRIKELEQQCAATTAYSSQLQNGFKSKDDELNKVKADFSHFKRQYQSLLNHILAVDSHNATSLQNYRQFQQQLIQQAHSSLQSTALAPPTPTVSTSSSISSISTLSQKQPLHYPTQDHFHPSPPPPPPPPPSSLS